MRKISHHSPLLTIKSNEYCLAISSLYENRDFNFFQILGNLSPVRKMYAYKLTDKSIKNLCL